MSEVSIETEDVIVSAARVLMKLAAELIYRDAHYWSTRPCATCKAITGLIGEPFGCDRMRFEKRAEKGETTNE